MLLQLLERSIRYDLAIGEQNDAAADFLNNVHDMRGIKDRLALS